MRFLLGAELGRAAPTRTVRDDGRMSDVRRRSARGAQHGSATVGRTVKGVICLQRVDERRNVNAALARTSYTPHPNGPRGIYDPRSAGGRFHALGGFLAWALPGPLSRLRVRELTSVHECRDIRQEPT